MSKYYPPEDQMKQFHCIHCAVFAKQKWGILSFGYHSTSKSPISVCQCEHCDGLSYWYESRMIIPAEAPVAPPHADMPASVIDEYHEARSIFARSPRAAVALLRLAIQKLMPELGEKGENINADIKSLVAKGLPVQVQQLLQPQLPPELRQFLQPELHRQRRLRSLFFWLSSQAWIPPPALLQEPWSA